MAEFFECACDGFAGNARCGGKDAMADSAWKLQGSAATMIMVLRDGAQSSCQSATGIEYEEVGCDPGHFLGLIRQELCDLFAESGDRLDEGEEAVGGDDVSVHRPDGACCSV